MPILRNKLDPFVIQINTPSFLFGKFRGRLAFLREEAFTELLNVPGPTSTQVAGGSQESQHASQCNHVFNYSLLSGMGKPATWNPLNPV